MVGINFSISMLYYDTNPNNLSHICYTKSLILMKRTNYNFGIIILTFGLLSTTFVACSDDSKINNPIITQRITELEQQSYRIGDPLSVAKDGLENITEIQIQIDGKPFENGAKIDEANVGLGKHNVLVQFLNGSEVKATREFSILVFADQPAEEWTYSTIATHPHNPKDFTQGFYYKDGYIFEGTGLTGQSRLVKYKLGTTTEEKIGDVRKTVFGEGITEMNDVVYQLTWQNRLIFAYDQDLKMIKEIPMPGEIREGWGITTMHDQFVVTEGSQYIHFYDKDFKYIRSVQAVDDKQGYSNLNELEYHDGLLYINIYHQNFIIVVDPKNGAVKARLNLDEFKPQQNPESDVLNGIAFKGDHLLVTGKLWDKVYELKIIK